MPTLLDDTAPATAERTTAAPYQPPLRRIYSIQLLLLLICSGASVLLRDWVVAYSVFCGGAIALIANAWFARQVFKYQGASMTPMIVRSFYRGETGKLVLVTVMFAMIFALIKPISVAALFCSFVAMILVNAAMAARFTTRRKQ